MVAGCSVMGELLEGVLVGRKLHALVGFFHRPLLIEQVLTGFRLSLCYSGKVLLLNLCKATER